MTLDVCIMVVNSRMVCSVFWVSYSAVCRGITRGLIHCDCGNMHHAS